MPRVSTKNINPDIKTILAVFDFDGTLTHRDSFVPFLRYAFGNYVFMRKLMGLIVPSKIGRAHV